MTDSKRSSAHVLRFARYLAIGGLNTVFGFSVYGVAIVAGAPVWLALLLANVAGVTFNFFTTGTLVFRASLRGRLLRFVGAYVCIYCTNVVLLAVVKHWVAGDILAQAVLVLPMALVAYLLINRFVFTDPPRFPERIG